MPDAAPDGIVGPYMPTPRQEDAVCPPQLRLFDQMAARSLSWTGDHACIRRPHLCGKNLTSASKRAAGKKKRPAYAPWQSLVDDALIGHIFARAHGVATPRVIACLPSAHSLPTAWPVSYGPRFVVKEIGRYNSDGVCFIDRVGGSPHSTLGTGAVVLGRADAKRVCGISSKSGVMVEEAVGKRMGTQLPREYNVRTFGETIGGVAVVSGRRTPDECTAWFDEEFERIDGHGCVVDSRSGAAAASKRSRLCPKGQLTRQPPGWTALIRAAKTLGSALGVAYTLDFFIDEGNQPVLAALSPWQPSGKRINCVTGVAYSSLELGYTTAWKKYASAAKRRKVDSACYLSWLWARAARERLPAAPAALSHLQPQTTPYSRCQRLLNATRAPLMHRLPRWATTAANAGDWRAELDSKRTRTPSLKVGDMVTDFLDARRRVPLVKHPRDFDALAGRLM